MKLIALTRFNSHDPGQEFEASDEDASVWIEEGLAKKAGEKREPAEMTVAELKDRLTEAGVEFSREFKKAELVALYEAHLAEQGAPKDPDEAA